MKNIGFLLSKKPKKQKIYREKLRNFINKKCIFRADPLIRYSNQLKKPGRIIAKSPMNNIGCKFYFYLQNILSDQHMLEYTSFLLIEKLFKSNKKFKSGKFQLAGLETGSIFLLVALQYTLQKYYNLNINVFSVKKQRKCYGLYNYISGIPNNYPIILVDDNVNTGNSLYQVKCIIENELLLETTDIGLSILNFNSQLNFTFELISLFSKDEFDLEYNSDEYWIPIDAQL